MTSRNTSPGWNATAGSNLTDLPQSQQNKSQPGSESPLGEPPGEMPGDFYKERVEYFRTQYDVMTGLRIAATLGGFFLLVLITLLYKSKCKKSSREGTPTPNRMDPTAHDLALLTASILPINEESPFSRLTKSRIECDFEEDPPPDYNIQFLHSPQLLLTQPPLSDSSSESSNQSELSLSSFRGRESSVSSGGLVPSVPGPSHPSSSGGGGKVRKKRKPSNQMSWLKQNIDIHVILPTPTISPSGSATFQHSQPPLQGRRKQHPRDLTLHRASDSDAVQISPYPSDVPPSASSSTCNPLFFLHAENLNLRYVDDTSSENIPTRASEAEDEEGEDVRSLDSDSVFTYAHDTKVEEFEDGDTEADQCRLILTQAHAQVHHRDSYCSGHSGESSLFESVNDYLESHRRRSSSTQTTLSDLRQFVGFVLPVPTMTPRSDSSAGVSATLTPSSPRPLNGSALRGFKDLSPKSDRDQSLLNYPTTNSSLVSPIVPQPEITIIPTSPSPSPTPTPTVNDNANTNTNDNRAKKWSVEPSGREKHLTPNQT